MPSLPLPITYFCEIRFFSFLVIKSKNKGILVVEDDIHFALARTNMRISNLVRNKLSLYTDFGFLPMLLQNVAMQFTVAILRFYSLIHHTSKQNFIYL